MSNALITQFFSEARELLEGAASGLLELEAHPGNIDVLRAVFRNFHTIKGTSGIFDEFPAITHACHAAEDLLDLARNAQISLNAGMIDVLLSVTDTIHRWLDHTEQNGTMPADALAAADSLSNRLKEQSGQRIEQTTKADAGPFDGDVAGVSQQHLVEWIGSLTEGVRQDANAHIHQGEKLWGVIYRPDNNVFFFGEDPLSLVLQMNGVLIMNITPNAPFPPMSEYDPFSCNLTFCVMAVCDKDSLDSLFQYAGSAVYCAEISPELLAFPSGLDELTISALPEPTDTAAPLVEVRSDALQAAKSMRIDYEMVNELMNLTGELIVAKNSMPFLIKKAVALSGGGELSHDMDDSYRMLSHISENLQNAMLQVRMLPISQVFQRFPRLVRDLSRKMGKQIELITEGENTRADKDVIEALSDPLIHMVRNSLDHGIELPVVREQNGKPPGGTILLRAYQEKASIMVEVRDNGAGINTVRIRQKAVEKGLMSQEQIDALSEEAVCNLIFTPGFSTAEKVSDVSGRGVGMDAVQNTMQRFGGSVSVMNWPGEGSSVVLRLPLSAAITKTLIVEASGLYFGLPADSVIETMQVRPEVLVPLAKGTGIAVRDKLVPVMQLARLLALDAEGVRSLVSIVLISHGGEVIGLEVSNFYDMIDVIVKPLGGMLAQSPYYNGTTILGDGRILLILNVSEIL